MKNVFKIPINVRFRDIDGMGHVNHARIFHLFCRREIGIIRKNFHGFGLFNFFIYLGPHKL